MEIIKISVNDIKPYGKNAKKHPQEQIEQIKNSIKQFGMNDPIAIWGKENLIVEGHGRLEACKQLGLTEVDCIRLDHLTDEERKAYTLAHNQLTMNTDFDLDILNEELNDIGIDMSLFGFEEKMDLSIEEKELEEDDYEFIEDEKQPKAKRGNIYMLGNHRLMCGDSTSESDVDKLMNEQIADLIVTDPPYNVNLGNIYKIKLMDHKEHYKGANTDEIANDNLEPTQFKEFLVNAFYNLSKNLKAGGSFYIWHAESSSQQFEEAMKENGLDIHQRIIWNKNTITLGFSDYQWKHEPCYYGWKKGASHYFVDDRTKKTVIQLEEKPFEERRTN